MRKIISFYFDIISPYSYIAFQLLQQLRKKYPEWAAIDLQYKPVYLGGLFKISGNQPPSTLANKGHFLRKDLERTTRIHQIPFQLPTKFPCKTISVQRILKLTEMKMLKNLNLESLPNHSFQFQFLQELIAQFYVGYFVKDLDIEDHSIILQLIQNALLHFPQHDEQRKIQDLLPIFTLESIQHELQNPQLKQSLEEATNDVFQLGAFGLPYFRASKPSNNGSPTDQSVDYFFGSDRLYHLAEFLDIPFEFILGKRNYQSHL